MGSAQSARGIQLGGLGTAARCGRIPSWDLSPALAGPRRAHFLRGGAPRPALGRLGKARGEGGSRLCGRELYSAPRPDLAASGGRGQSARCALSPRRGGTGPPAPGATVDRGGLSSVRPNRVVPPGRGLGSRKRRQGSAAMSATHPTRLETRTKESNARASQRVQAKPRGAMKVRAGARRLRWDPGPEGSGAPPARLARTVGEVERERVR